MTKEKDLKTLTYFLYGIFAASAVMQISFATIIFGAIALLIAIAIVYAKRDDTKDTPYEIHFQWLIRTFWIGTGVYLPILTVIGCAYALSIADINAAFNAMSSGQLMDEKQLMALIFKGKENQMFLLGIFTSVPFVGWWLWRCWKGYKALKDEKPIENVTSWV